jgi:hypothetical protein
MADFPQPETPITTATAGPTGEAHSADRRFPWTSIRFGS